MALQELLNQYEQIWTGGGGGGGDIPANSTKWKIITFNRQSPVYFIGALAPVPPPPPPPIIGVGNPGSLALPGFAVLGPVAFNISNPISLTNAFTHIAISGATSNTIIFCTHELNSANDIIYIGDGTLTSEANAAVSLKGPNVIYKLENSGGRNATGLGNIILTSNSTTAQCRVSVLTN